MKIKKKSFAYKLVEYTSGQDMPVTNISFIYIFILSLIWIPVSLPLYIILYFSLNKYFGDWNDFKNGFFCGSFTTIVVLIIGSLVGMLFSNLTGYSAPSNEVLKMLIIYIVGTFTSLFLIRIIGYIYIKITNSSKVEYLQ